MKKLILVVGLSILMGCSPLHISMQSQGQAPIMDERAYVTTTGASNVSAVDGEKTRNFFEFIFGFFQYTTSVDIPSGKHKVTFQINKYGYNPVFPTVEFDAKPGGKYQFEYDWSYSMVEYRLIDLATGKAVGKYK